MPNILVFDLGGTKIDAALFNTAGKITRTERVLTETKAGKKAVINQLLDLTRKYFSKELRGIVIGVPGIVIQKSGKVVNAPNLPNFKNIDLKVVFARFYPQLKILVQNDVRLFTLGESQTYFPKNKSLLGLTIGTGIGGGIVWDGKLYNGQSGFAGEWGHMVIAGNGIKCHCGQRGCWERYAATTAFLERVNQASKTAKTCLKGKNVRLQEVQEALAKGDQFAQKMLQMEIDYLAVGLANLIKIFDPEVIVIGGSLRSLWDDYQIKLKRAIEARLMGQKLKCKLQKSRLKNAVLQGGYAFYKAKQIAQRAI